MKKNIIVFGGSGFIGTSLCRLLERKKFPFVIIDKITSSKFPKKTVISDIRYPIKLQSKNFYKVIVNLAAEHRDDVNPRSLYYDTNVNGAKNVCTFATKNKINTIIFTSSVAVYGLTYLKPNESGVIAPFNEYGKTKHQAEQVYFKWQSYDPNKRRVIIVRPTVVFGEGNRGNIYNLISQISKNRFVMVGSGDNFKSIAYVENVSAFIYYLIKNSKQGISIFNYFDLPNITTKKFIKIISNGLKVDHTKFFRIPFAVAYIIALFFDIISLITGKKFLISRVRIKKFCANSVYTTSQKLKNFKPPYSLKFAILRTIESDFTKPSKP